MRVNCLAILLVRGREVDKVNLDYFFRKGSTYNPNDSMSSYKRDITDSIITSFRKRNEDQSSMTCDENNNNTYN
jgi:hypothetical protein